MSDGEQKGRESLPLSVGRETPLWRAVAIAALGLAAALGLLFVLWRMAMPLAIFFVAVVIAEAAAPLVEDLSRFVPRTAAIVGFFAVLGIMLIALFLLIAPPLIEQTQQAITDLPHLLHRVGTLVNHLAPGEGTRLAQALESNLPTYLNSAAAPPLSALAGLAIFAQILFFAAYWLIASPALSRFTLSLFPERSRGEVRGVLHEISSVMGGYVRATVLDALIVAFLTYIFLLFMGVKYPLVLAVVTFLGEFVPLIGPTVAEIPAVALGLLLSPVKALIVLAFYVVMQQIDGNVILPIILRAQSNISPLLVTFAVFMGAWMAGIVGALIAIPLAAALKVLVVRVVAPAVRRWAGA